MDARDRFVQLIAEARANRILREAARQGLIESSFRMSMWVYAIRNIETGRTYVGVTEGWDTRQSAHKAMLNQRHHPCSDLQNDWDNYGSGSFAFEVLQHETFTEPVSIYTYEREWMWKLIDDGTSLYNKAIPKRMIESSPEDKTNQT